MKTVERPKHNETYRDGTEKYCRRSVVARTSMTDPSDNDHGTHSLVFERRRR